MTILLRCLNWSKKEEKKKKKKKKKRKDVDIICLFVRFSPKPLRWRPLTRSAGTRGLPELAVSGSCRSPPEILRGTGARFSLEVFPRDICPCPSIDPLALITAVSDLHFDRTDRLVCTELGPKSQELGTI